MDTMRGSRAQLTRRGLVVAFVVVLVGGAVFGGAVFGFGLGGSGGTAPATPTVAPGTVLESSTPTATVTPTATRTTVPTPTRMPTVSPTATRSHSSTPTRLPATTPTPVSTPPWQAYEDFIDVFLGEVDAESQVPIRARGLTVREGTFWFIVNATDPDTNQTRRTKEWGGIVTGYARAYHFYEEGQISGNRTNGMRVLEVDDGDQPPKTFRLNNSVTRQIYNGGLRGPELVDAYHSTLRNQTDKEKTIAVKNDKQGSNETLAAN